jgi:aminocarboxymuconate-semialdehyde decarboxylase
MAAASRIDVHTHVVPPFWAEDLPRHGGDASGWPTPPWSPESVLKFMDEQQIAVSVLSLTDPSVTGWSGQERRQLARRVNEYTAGLVAKWPDRFGNFATLPLPDVEGAVAEVEYSLDKLGADGVILLSNYEGNYLGHPMYAPLWKSLESRSAVVFIHPGHPLIKLIDGMPGPLVEYPYETTRNAVHMVATGVMDRYPHVKIILSHAGGFLPYAVHRFAEPGPVLNPKGPTAAELLDKFRLFYFDTALTGTAAFPSLMAFAGSDRVLYGSDFCYAPPALGKIFTAQLDAYHVLSDDQKTSINHGNAKRILSRFG